MLKIGVIGTGHLGRIHLNCINNIEHLHLVGFHDSSISTAEKISNEYELRHYEDARALIHACDVIDIVTPTNCHLDYITLALESGKHVFVEKPVVATRDEIHRLWQLQQDYPELKVQVGHVERFNPVYKTLKKYTFQPKFIEVHRLASFKPRSLDISVVLDLMIHDLDLICDIVNSPIISVQANGVSIVNSSADICNARIQFDNGCVANVTASRISMKSMRLNNHERRRAGMSVDVEGRREDGYRIRDHRELGEYGGWSNDDVRHIHCRCGHLAEVT